MRLKNRNVQGMIKLIIATAFTLSTLLVSSAFAQQDTNMQILRDKVKADKKVVVAANMELTEAEAKTFWPVYDGYQKELQVLNERLAKTILVYAEGYNNKTLTDAQAKKLADEALAIDEDEIKMRRSYAMKLNQVLPAKKAARYLQLENKIRAAIRYDLASSIPLVQ
jgi:hypothetical protein